MQEHLQLLAEKFEAQGMPREEAAAAARRQFGNVTLLEEERRELRRAILVLVMRDVAVILAGGLTAGILISLGATRVLATFLFGPGARDPVAIFIAVVLLSGVACVAGFIPARRATEVDPMVALRYE